MSTTLSHSCVASTTPLSPLEQFHQVQEADDETLIAWLKELNELALEELIRRYSGRLCGYACLRMDDRVDTPEVIVNGAFWTLWSGLEKGRYEDVETVDEFLGLIITLVKNSIYKTARDLKTQKRGGNHKRRNFEYILAVTPDSSSSPYEPEAYGEFIESIRNQLNSISDKRLGDILAMRVQGWLLTEIGERVGIQKGTVRTRLKMIKRWLTKNTGKLQIAPA